MDDPIPPRRRALRAGRQSEPFGRYAITKCLEDRRPILAAPRPAEIILGSYQHLRETGQIKLLGYCIMPDHYHALFVLLPGKSLSNLVKSVGTFTGLRLNRLFGMSGQFWEEGFHDHKCRDEDDVIDRLTYIERNPVTAGLAIHPEEWLYSSAHPSRAATLDRDWYRDWS
ncbi:MAG: transposase [Pirellulales bacterium]